jgi:TRAP-type C4-dicarboxylate transport system substrate-binding protein
VLRACTAFCLLLLSARVPAETTLRIATLAPEGSSWMRHFHRFADRLEKRFHGELKLKLYPGGMAGDERHIVRKMRVGELDGAAVTAIGLGLIHSEVMLFEVPFLITRAEEVEYLREKLDAELRHMFEERGYVLLAWGDIGSIYIFTGAPLGSRADFPKLKMWAWVDDPVVRAVFEEIGLAGVPLAVPDVLPSLESGLVNGCYGSPLSVVALRWQSRLKYMFATPLTYGQGAAVITRRAFDRLTPEQKSAVLAEARELGALLSAQVKTDNERALAGLQKAGIKVVEPPKDLMHDFATASRVVRVKLEGSVYSAQFRKKVEELLDEFRARGQTAPDHQ